MSAGARVAGFAALLVAIFALALVAGRAIDPETGTPAADATTRDAAGEHGHDAAAPAPAAAGLAQARDGLRLETSDTTLTARRPARFEFRIVDDHGQAVRDFQTEQGRRMHLVVVRRDLRHFQHVHPVQDQRGAWTTSLRLPAAGPYRAYADFRAGGRRTTLGVGVRAPGDFEHRPLPGPTPTSAIDGYDVELAAARSGALRFRIRRDGRPVAALQPYLGARGHLVVLRARDLAYEHVHPLSGSAAPGEIAFSGAASEAGSYRLFLQFRHGGRVHTAAFTREASP